MPGSRYALVSYVKDRVGDFIQDLRQELHPDLPHLAAHLSFLPPRKLRGEESAALELLEEVCSQIEPFEVSLGEVETFIPVTPTVFIRVCHASSRMRDLHDRLNAGALFCEEEWPYLPHLTIVKMGAEEQAQQAYRLATHRWSEFHASRTVRVEELVFVREEGLNHWIDLAGVPLGRATVKT